MKLLIRKYLASKVTDEEKQKLYSWLKESDNNIKVFKEEIALHMLDKSTDKDVNPQAAYEEFKNAINRKPTRSLKQVSIRKLYKYAAVIILCVSSVYFFNWYKGEGNFEGDNEIVKTNDIDNENIVLTLADGSTKIIEQAQKQITYLKELPKDEVLEYNEIKVPKGQVFKVILSDSTIVWLNADTKLRYPKRFISTLKTRTIELEGEAFFDVTHNADKPFIVLTKDIDIRVLGTKFSVSSYDEDRVINTTLVEGSVNVMNTINDDSIIIKPNFQASFNKVDKELTSKEVNVFDFTAWMQKIIVFNDTPFELLKSKIERTYNVEIINENEALKTERFTGQFDIEAIEVIFKALSTSYHFNYEIQDKTITIKE